MSQLGTRAEINGIVVDKFLIDGWPDEFSGFWMGIYNRDEVTTAYLIDSKENSEGTVVEINNAPKDFVSLIEWDKEFTLLREFTDEKYRNSGIGYAIGVWARTWVAVRYGKMIKAPYGADRTIIVKGFLERFKNTYNDESIIL